MDREKNSRFDGEKSKNKMAFLQGISYPIGSFLLALIVFVYLVVGDTAYEDAAFFYIFTLLLALQALVFFLFKRRKNKVISLEFNPHTIKLSYRRGNREETATIPLKDTVLELFELRDYQSFFMGFQIDLIHQALDQKFVILEEYWTYEQFEAIYIEFKHRKKEDINEGEKQAFKQLQLMNNTLVE
ncbi:hypothetical protein [Flavobacterium sp. JP2137]|uniref:hypothetical protein n=1 Tax=Flavobacterium sp. JP2137 TaxID=3414510 RepID=UPI003D2FD703